ncbi:MAG: BrnA antitoxin family protein [Deltaproteobacteria bacterium]|nr:BrnA antitoxin family protein [Deltaproteobacteria bacterium]
MKERIIIRRSAGDGEKGKTNWARVAKLSEKEIVARAKSDPDAQPTDDEFWKNARVVMPERKVPISLRVDREVLTWFKRRDRRYQTLINAVLKAYMQAHSSTE